MPTHSRYTTFPFIQSRMKFKMLQWSSGFWIGNYDISWSLACSLTGCLKFSYPHAASRSPNKAPLFFGSGLGIGTYQDLGTPESIWRIQWYSQFSGNTSGHIWSRTWLFMKVQFHVETSCDVRVDSDLQGATSSCMHVTHSHTYSLVECTKHYK